MNTSFNTKELTETKKAVTENAEHDLLATWERCSRKLYLMRGSGHMGQKKIVNILATAGEMSQFDLQNMLEIKPGSMSEVLTKMEKKGYITRSKAPNDKRMVLLRITQCGLNWNSSIQKNMSRDSKSWFSALSSSEQKQLHEMLEKLLVNWEEDT